MKGEEGSQAKISDHQPVLVEMEGKKFSYKQNIPNKAYA